jgi:site-specific DNA recombinase
MLTAGRGTVVAEFFDSGESRTLAWARRPRAAALVAALADPDRGWDAIVIGEYERAFYGAQYASMARCLSITGFSCGCRRSAGWSTGMPRTTSRRCLRWACRRSGRSPGPGSGCGPRWPPRPVSRAGTWAAGRRTGTGSATLDRTRTRPTPRGGDARTGSNRTPGRLRSSSGCFAQRLAGHSAARITRALNDAGIPCPSAADPQRNPHRTGATWTLRTVAAILANPRYTGRQVWNRQRTDFDLADPANTALGHKQVQRWNLPEGWVISRRPAHAALVSEADFITAQDTAAPRGPAGPAARRYLLAALLACGRCGRRLESAWVQRQGRLPMPPRACQRRAPRPRPAEEHIRPRGPGPAAPGRPRHPPGRRRLPWRRRDGAGRYTHPEREPDRPTAGIRHRPYLRPGHSHDPRERSRPRRGHHRPGPLTPPEQQPGKGGRQETEAPARAGGRAWVTIRHARK